jgi:hypothetical protein
MTEQEWLGCDDPEKLLWFLKGKASPSKLRLFGCACHRLGELPMDREDTSPTIEVMERFADGSAGEEEVRRVTGGLHYIVGQADPWLFATTTARSVFRFTSAPTYLLRRVATLLHEIFGPLPFRSVIIARSWLSPTVKQLAEAIYTDRAFDRMPILADALEDAGCDNADILNHCRQPGQHVRGCWVVDLMLGKK